MGKYLSIVVPVYNEVDNLKLLNDKIKEVLIPEGISYEVIYVDDCSKDGSYKVLEKLARDEDNVKVIKFKRNFGQTAAMSAGFDYAHGEIIIPLDADLQNDPQDIPAMIEKYKEGYDIVSGWRKNRQDNAIRSFFSRAANQLISKLTGVHLHDYGCSLKVYNAKFIKSLYLYGELHRFIPAIAAIQGANIVEMPVYHNARIFGESKYNLSRTSKVLLDLLTIIFLKKFITKPMHFFGNIALSVFSLILVSLFMLVINVFIHFAMIDYSVVFLWETIMIIFGLQLLGAGIVTEILIRSYYETGNKKIYNIDKTLKIE